MKNKYLLALSVGVMAFLASMALNLLLTTLFPSLSAEYVNPAFRPWSDPLMSLFFLYPVVLGVLLSWVWLKTKKSWSSGIDFGLTMAILYAVPAFLVNYSSFTFSLPMILTWTAMGFVNVIVAGLVLEKLDG